jgi:Circularly permutated YpsA SLOG family
VIRRHPTEYYPEFADLYGAVELETESYPARTEASVLAANPTLWFGNLDTAGYRATVAAIRKHQKPMDVIQPGASRRPSDFKAWLSITKVGVINIAGPRKSMQPGIGKRAERFMR